MISTLPKRLNSGPGRRIFLIAGLVILAAFVIYGIAFGPASSQADASGLGSQSLTVLIVLAFVGGVVSFVSPYTLPILPAYFAFATQSGRSKIALNTLAFMLGVATMFSLLGASASALGRLIIQRQELLLLIGGAIVMLFGVLSLLGKGFTGVGRKESATPSTNPGGSYIFGLTFSLGWSSCVGPILGVVLTLAASTGSVARGMLLLFVYAIGLGLPLIIVSTFFGRASRKSFFWRVLRGKGWFWTTSLLVVGLVWALAVWRILVAFSQYAFDNLAVLAGQSSNGGHQIGLLFIVIAGAALWAYSGSGPRKTTIQLHSTQLFSGALFILMAVLMLDGTLADFNSLIPADLAIWFSGLEESLITLFC
ncbi:MAG TPA: cytochrome c biogenesis CcdA family protein [candidate division Zixibacteria bacterium]|nr:cytochrome c biogenesis CcdA family protein [candidate division Zixibacteria bacterium]